MIDHDCTMSTHGYCKGCEQLWKENEERNKRHDLEIKTFLDGKEITGFGMAYGIGTFPETEEDLRDSMMGVYKDLINSTFAIVKVQMETSLGDKLSE